MDKKLPVVSIITIVYNGVRHIEDTIKSVITQTYPNIEYIIIDGNSTDGTQEVIKRYEHKIARWISEKDRGISDAFNKGIAMASGALIGMINADDWYEPDAIASVVANYTDNNTIICGNVKLYNNDVRFNIKRSSLLKIRREMTVWHPGMFVPSELYKEVGSYDERYKVLMDYDFVVRCVLHGVNFRFVNINISSMRAGGVSNRLISKSMMESLDIKNRYFGRNLMHKIDFVFFSVYYQTVIFLKRLLY